MKRSYSPFFPPQTHFLKFFSLPLTLVFLDFLNFTLGIPALLVLFAKSSGFQALESPKSHPEGLWTVESWAPPPEFRTH